VLSCVCIVVLAADRHPDDRDEDDAAARRARDSHRLDHNEGVTPAKEARFLDMCEVVRYQLVPYLDLRDLERPERRVSELAEHVLGNLRANYDQLLRSQSTLAAPDGAGLSPFEAWAYAAPLNARAQHSEAISREVVAMVFSPCGWEQEEMATDVPKLHVL
jgi:hypothetical protein